MKNNKKKKSGFTLVELLVVLVILMVIGMIAVQNFSGEADKAKVKATKTSIAQIETSLERFKLDVGRYPTQDEGLIALIEAPSGTEDKWAGKYLAKKRSLRDAWDHPFRYTSPGPEGEAFEILSFGADGKEGGEKINADLSSVED